ncbi:MAG: acetate kinase [Synechococcales cyanobacterium C42_A2020_086]|jgi:acetate kinase|nr:acetate kinase [Synechococcales cyanobacterium C42_A2020_086]
MKILVMNAGSSSQKSCLYEISGETLPESPPAPLWEAQIDWTHQQNVAEMKIKTLQGTVLKQEVPFASRDPVIAQMLETLWTGDTQVIAAPSDIDLVGHRVVHGGHKYRDSTWITPEVKAEIADLATLAPVHNPVNLQGIESIEQMLSTIRQVAVFDTAFHARMPDAMALYPVPYEWSEKGIRRYGFHGTSHRYCAQRAAQILGQPLKDLRIVTCHLGNGCSLAAVRNGYSVNTTMGFTPLDGLMMGNRSGAVDPSILIYLMREAGYTADELDHTLNQESGLLGVSGVSNDLRLVMQAIAAGNSRAQLALEMYIQRLRQFIGSMIASLGGLDVLVFTAGVGENAPHIRAGACEAFAYMGLQVDPEKNASSPRDQDIATANSTVRVLVIHTQEDWAIAKECWELAQTTSPDR